jgi:hypothetical protein
MTNLLNKLSGSFFFRITALTFILFLAYFPLLLSEQVCSPDAEKIMGSIKSFSSFNDYLKGLISFKTLDFQPIRDLALYLDQKVYDTWHINTFIPSNLILWLISCLLTLKILKNIFPQHKESNLFYIVILFSVYPLFSSTLSWAMAKKHILSFLFILAATKEATAPKGSNLKLILFYIFSVLSQPISVLWPLWLLLNDYLHSINRNKKLALYISLLLLMTSVLLINNSYYQQSPIFHEFYGTKSNYLFDFKNRFFALGHYFFQIFMPYWLAFSYVIKDLSTYLGLFLFIVLGTFIFRSSSSKKFLLSWAFFALAPLIVVSTETRLLSDTYLLIPAFGMLIILIHSLERNELGKQIIPASIILLGFWVYCTSQESNKWKSGLNFAKNDFERSPNCASSFLYARLSFIENEKIPAELKDYIVGNHCFKTYDKYTSNYRMVEYLQVMVYMIYYENDLNEQNKIKALQFWSNKMGLASFFLAAIYINRNDYKAADLELKKLIDRSEDASNFYFEPVAAKVLMPYCLKNKKNDCINFMKNFTQAPSGPFD